MVQNNPRFSQINSSKKGIQILLSLSVLAFISYQYSSLLSSYISSFKLFSYSTTDRHYIFLLCNGLMLLVIKTSGLFASPTPPGTEFYRDSHVIKNHVQPSHHQSRVLSENNNVKNSTVISHQSTELSKNNNVKLQTDYLPETKAETNTNIVTEVEEAKRGITVIDQGDEYVTSTEHYEEEEQVNDLVDEQEQEQGQEDEELEIINIEEEEEEQGIMLWSTEELNKKCDDFIRRMKYGIKFEAPLVMV